MFHSPVTFFFIIDMQRAYLSQDEVVTIVERLYGLQVTSSSELNSYDDLNLHVQVSQTHWDNSNIPKVSPDGYVLKILNSLDSTKQKFIGTMNSTMENHRQWRTTRKDIAEFLEN